MKIRSLNECEVYGVWVNAYYESNTLCGLYKSIDSAKKEFDTHIENIYKKDDEPDDGENGYSVRGATSEVTIEIHEITP